MAMSSAHGRARSEINVTPLIDIVLVLLIIFIVMVPSLERSLTAALPRPVEGTPPPATTSRAIPLVLTLDRVGILRLQQDPVSLAELPERLRGPLLKQPHKLRKVFLKVDEDQPYAQVVAVMDRIRLASERTRAASLLELGTLGAETKVVVGILRRRT